MDAQLTGVQQRNLELALGRRGIASISILLLPITFLEFTCRSYEISYQLPDREHVHCLNIGNREAGLALKRYMCGSQ